MNVGKKIRMKRIINRKSGKTVIIPMDHGVSLGPIQGLQDIDKTVNMVIRGGANATIVHKGIVTSTNRTDDTDIGLIIHLSASTSLNPEPNNKIAVCDVAGRFCSVLLDKMMNAGNHEMSFGTNLPAGVYFIEATFEMNLNRCSLEEVSSFPSIGNWLAS